MKKYKIRKNSLADYILRNYVMIITFLVVLSIVLFIYYGIPFIANLFNF